ncbi:hypothetical protein [Cellulomonas sp. APG4]|uniref:hypothetical protein n=1 Tax=Cellulomonas sp. APG4 TaxID=1538656 RepID=UPI00137B2811|nr:hypothetical protein [Cellulomonas sp. APG4]
MVWEFARYRPVEDPADVSAVRSGAPHAERGWYTEREWKAALKRFDLHRECARAWGCATAKFEADGTGPKKWAYDTLAKMLEGALALARAVQDVTKHVAHYRIPVIDIDGVMPDAKMLDRATGAYARTVEHHEPATPAETARLLLRKVRLEYVADYGGAARPHWWPVDVETAVLLLDAAGELSGTPVVPTPAPAVQWRGGRPVITEEMDQLMPALRRLPSRMRLSPDSAQRTVRKVPDKADVAAPVTGSGTKRSGRVGAARPITSASLYSDPSFLAGLGETA